jgi:4-amino-4-deoxy-L-arabinose transferase-like glycosyltransferase
MWRLLTKDYFFVWLAIALIGLWFRPLTPVDETRAVSVAWEMWQRHDFLVPYLNGEPYSHKPPLLQWCIQLTWLLFGVNELSARLVAPLFGLANLYLAAVLARRLWPGDKQVEKLAPWFLLAMPLWSIWTTLTLYDMLVTFFAQLGALGVLRAAQGDKRFGWGLTGLAIGGGIVAKGPIILLLILPTALLAPWWMETKPATGWRLWYQDAGTAIGIGAVLGLGWAIPAGIAGGEEYRNLIFWGQSVGRVAHSFAHMRPFWWYLECLPLLLFPWFWWPPAWKGWGARLKDSGQRFCLTQMVIAFVVLSLISGKQVHYLLPLYPFFALYIVRGLNGARSLEGRWSHSLVGLWIALPGAAALLAPQFGGANIAHEAVQIALHAPDSAKWALVVGGCALALWPIADTNVEVCSVCVLMFGLFLLSHIGFGQFGRPLYDMQPFSDKVASVAQAGADIVHWQKYNGDFNFLGRLPKPIREVADKQSMLRWLDEHPQGYVILERRSDHADVDTGAEFAQPYRGSRRVQLWRAAEVNGRLSENPEWLNK